MIINIRGTSGSGKTVIIRGIMEKFSMRVPLGDNIKRPIAYELSADGLPTTYVMGSYENVCGGCDTIKTQDEICDRIRRYALQGHVLVEGLLMSHIFGRYAELAKELYPIPYVWAFLDTPLQVCLDRINMRRRAKGKLDPVNPENTTKKWHDMRRVFKKCELAKLDVRWLDHQKGTEIVWDWLNASS